MGIIKKIKSIVAPESEIMEFEGKELPDIKHTGQIKLGIIVGHEKKKPGAEMPKILGAITEYDFNTGIAKSMKAYAEKAYKGQLVIEIIFRDGIGITGAYNKAIKSNCDCVIELHFNAYDRKAKGTSTLTTIDSRDQQFTQLVHEAICKVFKRTGKLDRGIKALSRSDRGGINVNSFPKGANCLVEPAFGDNMEEATLLLKNQQAYSECMIDAVMAWANQVKLVSSPLA